MRKATKVWLSLALGAIAFLALIPALYVSRSFNISFDTILFLLTIGFSLAIASLWQRE